MDQSPQDTTVVGVDPGVSCCGIGVVAGSAARPRLVAAQATRTPTDAPLEQRLLGVHTAVAAVIARYRPDVVAVERVLFSSNVRTAMATGQAAGVALLAAAQAGVPVRAYSPTDVKLTVAGAGDADKDAVGRLVAAQLGLDRPPRPVDVTDALAVALTQLVRGRLERLVAGTPAATALADAHEQADRAARGGWEAVLGGRAARPASPGRADGGADGVEDPR